MLSEYLISSSKTALNKYYDLLYVDKPTAADMTSLALCPSAMKPHAELNKPILFATKKLSYL